MKKEKLKLFTPGSIGPVRLRNRSIRSAAFEGMCPDGIPSESLFNYHRSVAEGGIGMTTVAYVAVSNDGRSFAHQAWMRPEIVPNFKRLTDAVHRGGAKASVQIGHCGNMADSSATGERPLAPTGRVNIYGPTFPRAMNEDDMLRVAADFGRTVELARKSGFDAVEVHAGHGYLISQFLSPYTNRRKDRWGGSLENRARFMRLVLAGVRKAAKKDMAVIVKMNLRDGFRGGMELDEAVEVAGMIEECGADAIVPSGGFVSRAPMYVMRGEWPRRELVRHITSPFMKFGISVFSRFMIQNEPFREGYFLPDALSVRKAVKIPVIYVGGVLSLQKIEEILGMGFDFVAMARALIIEPDFISRLKNGRSLVSRCAECAPCNRCIATMYTGEAECMLGR
ncbi:MAG: NADH:flavin oxidoreductase [Spirochaetes bacterium]|jgi:2,4-dienoyl-CoA reductase-like NADH-dependent reductase (Old Yellow Enzyme family)|nr:NADH:flavin oxidoreductase [Spirochaetota bacterium]